LSLASLFPRPPAPTLFPYTTLFRSRRTRRGRIRHGTDKRPEARGSRRMPGGTTRDQPHRQLTACSIRRPARKADLRQGLRKGLRSEEHTSELQSRFDLVCRLLLEKK